MNARHTLRWLAIIFAAITLLAIGASIAAPKPPTTQDDSLSSAPVVQGPVVHGTPGPKEDDPGFDCRTQGNRICGPKANYPAGCYAAGLLVIPWTNYLNPKADPLYGQFESPC